MTKTYLSTLLQLRWLVGFLGERPQFDWWPTSFQDRSSRLFLEPVFAKTTRLAQYHGVLEAARRVHDEHLSVGCYHLFRLPEEVEQDLHALVQGDAAQEALTATAAGKDAALAALKQAGSPGAKFGDGPIAVGSIHELDASSTLGAIAAAYAAAFEQDRRTYPYLVG